ncbi:MAG: ROK family protein [Verrucomicrobiota bacterium]|jgi:glucokinase
MSSYIGIEIGGTKLQLVLGDKTGKILQRRQLEVEPASGAEGIRGQIRQTLPELMRLGQVQAIGVGFGGPVDWKTGKICRSHQIEGWSEFDLGSWLRQLAGLPVVVDNDANVGALGEAGHGAGLGFDPVFYITLGSGVGGGLVREGQIYHGAAPGESEIGHVRLDRQGTIVEARCSGWAVDARIRALNGQAPNGVLARLAGGRKGGEARHLAAALEQGDAAAQQILRDTADDLAFALSHVVHLCHPQIIVMGGGLSRVGEPLRAAVAGALSRFIMEVFMPGPRLVLAALGEDAVPTGALTLAKGEGRGARVEELERATNLEPHRGPEAGDGSQARLPHD